MLTEQRSRIFEVDKCLHQDILPWIDNDYESLILYLILLV